MLFLTILDKGSKFDSCGVHMVGAGCLVWGCGKRWEAGQRSG